MVVGISDGGIYLPGGNLCRFKHTSSRCGLWPPEHVEIPPCPIKRAWTCVIVVVWATASVGRWHKGKQEDAEGKKPLKKL